LEIEGIQRQNKSSMIQTEKSMQIHLHNLRIDQKPLQMRKFNKVPHSITKNANRVLIFPKSRKEVLNSNISFLQRAASKIKISDC